MYLRLLARRVQQQPGATIKGNVPHPFQKEPFSQGCPGPVPGMAGIPLKCEEDSQAPLLNNRK